MDDLKERIQRYVSQTPGRPPKLQAIIRDLKIPIADKRSVKRIMRELVVDGTIKKLPSQGYMASQSRNTIVGVVRMSPVSYTHLTLPTKRIV